MTEGRVVEWHKQDGEVVEQGEPVVTVETKSSLRHCWRRSWKIADMGAGR